MKSYLRRPFRCQPKGFTLVELLVVIAIIAILASVILYAGGAAIKLAKRTKAANTANQLQTAILGYYTEYSVYPVPSGVASADYELKDDDTGTVATAWGSLAECLSGMIQPSTGTTVTTTPAGFTNTRSIAFLTLKTTDVGSGTGNDQDAPLNPIPPNTTKNLYFNLAVDSAYTGVLGAGDTTGGSMSWLPAFSPPVVGTGTFPNTGGSSTAGVAIWANCTGSSTVINSNQWVHTY